MYNQKQIFIFNNPWTINNFTFHTELIKKKLEILHSPVTHGLQGMTEINYGQFICRVDEDAITKLISWSRRCLYCEVPLP